MAKPSGPGGLHWNCAEWSVPHSGDSLPPWARCREVAVGDDELRMELGVSQNRLVREIRPNWLLLTSVLAPAVDAVGGSMVIGLNMRVG